MFGSIYILPQSGNKYFEFIFVITTNDKDRILLAVKHNTIYWQVPSIPIPIFMPPLHLKTIFSLTSNTSINFAYMKSCSILSFACHLLLPHLFLLSCDYNKAMNCTILHYIYSIFDMHN